MIPRLLTALVLASPAVAQQPQHLVVPAVNATSDGSHTFFVAGTVEPRRQLTLIDAAMLAPLAGHALTGLAFRRNAEDIAFPAGSATLTVRLSHAARAIGNASERFADNHGNDLTTVFQGTVTLPYSPGTTATTVGWTPENTVDIPFQVPFVYAGGTLALEITGTPDPVNATSWWAADAVWQPAGGTATAVGNGCGPYGGPQGEWSFLTATNLAASGTATFQALGAPGELACWMIAGAASAQAVDLGPFGAPGCYAHLVVPLGNAILLFGPPLIAQQPGVGGLATFALQLPASPMFVGASFASQWFAFGSAGLTSSNAHQWTTASQPPPLAMTLVSSPVLGGEPATGKVIPSCGHVFRFEFQ